MKKSYVVRYYIDYKHHGVDVIFSDKEVAEEHAKMMTEQDEDINCRYSVYEETVYSPFDEKRGGRMDNLKIKVTNPYYEKEYVALDVPLSNWINFLENHRMGNEKCFSFLDISGTRVVVNPENFASIEVVEVLP